MQIELTQAHFFPSKNANKLDVPNAENTLWSGANAHGGRDCCQSKPQTRRIGTGCRAAVFAAQYRQICDQLTERRLPFYVLCTNSGSPLLFFLEKKLCVVFCRFNECYFFRARSRIFIIPSQQQKRNGVFLMLCVFVRRKFSYFLTLVESSLECYFYFVSQSEDALFVCVLSWIYLNLFVLDQEIFYTEPRCFIILLQCERGYK